MKKTVLITGASRGIGRACAIKFAMEGYFVYLNYRSSTEKIREVAKTLDAIPEACYSILQGDVGSSPDVEKMFAQIKKEGRHIDLLINNAGIAHMGLLHDMTDEEWNRILNTNLSSVFYCCRKAIPGMLKAGGGVILNVSSMWGRVGASYEVAYSASKAGVNGLTRALAKELAPNNIQVNALAFGVIDTDMNQMLSKEDRENLAYEIPIGRFASSEEAAQMIWDTVNTPFYMTGQIIGFDGGYI